MEQLLAGKNAFITGAGANIGRAIALEMAAQGASIYFVEKDAARSAALEKELKSRGSVACGFAVDISKTSSIDRILRELKQKNVVIDILVNNVGITTTSKETTPEAFQHWQEVMDTNVLAPLYLSRLIAQNMIEAGVSGSVVFITSIHQWVYHGGDVYSATKAGLGMVIDELAVSLAGHGIRVNGIAPGACCERPDGHPFPQSDTPLYHETVKPCYIGRAAVFLCSDYFSHYTTGTVLKVDGGLSLYSFRNRDLICPPPPISFPRANKWIQRGYKYWRKLRQLMG